MRVSRRSLVQTGLLAAVSPALGAGGLGALTRSALAQAQGQSAQDQPQWRHALSLLDEPRYPAGFAHFDYVNPNAPKGGVVRITTVGTFDNFNLVVGPARGTIAGAINVVFDTLLIDAMDEVATDYCLVAEAVSYPDDFSSATYRLRREAKWHDGKPVTPEDVIFTLESYQKYEPQLSTYYQRVVKAEKIGERDVKFTFDQAGNRELPQILGQLQLMAKHWWEGVDADGKKRNIGETTLEPPLGCGAYRIKSFMAGRNIIYERVKDYWGKDINVRVGQHNLDELRLEYFRDPTVAIEAFKADQADWRRESSAKNWATAYDFPAVADKRVVLEEFPLTNLGIMQAFVFNTRRAKFQDPRVRRAFNYAFDFEELNKQIFYGQYQRISSYFDGTELASSGLPAGRELEILETLRDKVSPEVFMTPYKNPVGGTPEAQRNNLREALRLMKEAGYEIRDRKLTDVKTGMPMTVEFLLDDPELERIYGPFKASIERLGVDSTIRIADDSQYQTRMRQWDFDLTMTIWGQSLSPGNEQRDFFGSKAADTPGSQNTVGIKDAAVDALIERIVYAKSRVELVATAHALDRVLLAHNYVVPLYYYNKVRIAHWDRFSHPEKMPKYGNVAFPYVWWWDEAKAAKAGSRR